MKTLKERKIRSFSFGLFRDVSPQKPGGTIWSAEQFSDSELSFRWRKAEIYRERRRRVVLQDFFWLR